MSTITPPRAAAHYEPSAFLLRALAGLPDLQVYPVPIGFAISSSAWVKRDQDRCGAYVVPSPVGWSVQDCGDVMGLLDGPHVDAWMALVEASGATIVDWTIEFPPAPPEAAAANVVQMLALLWRLDRESSAA